MTEEEFELYLNDAKTCQQELTIYEKDLSQFQVSKMIKNLYTLGNLASKMRKASNDTLILTNLTFRLNMILKESLAIYCLGTIDK